MSRPTSVDRGRDGWHVVAPGAGCLHLETSTAGSSFSATVPMDAEAARLLELYLPLCAGAEASALAIGHVGQSLDGYIAADSGESRFVTGPADVEHTHRLRALFDAVLVGRSTVESDDPELTTRLVLGADAARVVVDPERRLDESHRVLSDRKARTLLVCGESAAGRRSPPHVEIVSVRADGSRLCPGAIRAALERRGLRRLFVEGGGVTLSYFLEAGALDRAHVAVSPVLIGSGRRGLSVPAAPTLGEAWRPHFRRFLLGDDVLYDFDLRAAAPVRSV